MRNNIDYLSASSFFIGLVLGMIIMMIIVWLCYDTRTFIFEFCPHETPACLANDYFNNPGEALAHDPQLTPSDILYLNNDDELMYIRVQKNFSCVPEKNQTIQMIYPQYCSFSGTGGISATYKQTFFGSDIYQPQGNPGSTVRSNANCKPVSGSGFTDGIPLVQWDKSPIVS